MPMSATGIESLYPSYFGLDRVSNGMRIRSKAS